MLPSDSQYEVTAVLGGGPDDSQIEMPAFGDDGLGSAEMEAVRSFDAGSSEIFLAVPWYFNVIASWGRRLFYVATGFGVASLGVLAFLLVKALVSGPIISASVTALLIGCVGMIAFLLISLSATALTVLLVDLARSVRMLIQQTERHVVGPIDEKRREQARLSQPVG
jgi:hypothetical protein